ncbi:MAG: hypothetical protein V3T90_07850 [Anaerolineae bacterium]
MAARALVDTLQGVAQLLWCYADAGPGHTLNSVPLRTTPPWTGAVSLGSG